MSQFTPHAPCSKCFSVGKSTCGLMATEYGLMAEKDGIQGYLSDSPSIELLRDMGVEAPEFHGKPLLPGAGEARQVEAHPLRVPVRAVRKLRRQRRLCGDVQAVRQGFRRGRARKKKSSKLGKACELVPVRLA